MEQIGDDTYYDNERDNEVAFQKPLLWNKHAKPLSWSAISSFKYDKEQWYKKYVLGIKDEGSREMDFGKLVGGKLENDPTFLPEIPRAEHMEYKLHVTFGDVQLIGYIDSYGDAVLHEYKTGKNPWTQEKVDNHGQITMYLLMLYIQHNILPEDVQCYLHWMPTEEKGDFSIGFVEPIEENIKHFTTKRTTKDIVEFGVEINKIIKQMEIYE